MTGGHALDAHADADAVLAEYLTHLATERGLAANTLASYRRDLRRYLEYLEERGRRSLAEVREEDVAAFLDALRAGDERHRALCDGSAARAASAVRGLHRFAVREGLASHDPAGRVRPPRRPRRTPRAIGAGEVERLLAALGPEDAPLTLRNRALLEVLYGTGARISEVVGLAVDDVELGDDGAGDGGERRTTGVERVRLRGTGGRTRAVPLGRSARDALRAYLTRARPEIAAHGRGRGTHALFLNARGGRLTRQGAWGVLQAAAERAGLGGISPHMLRHSFAARLIDDGADVRVVRELLGLASVSTAQVYTLVSVD